MDNRFQREKLLIGEDGFNKLQNSKVIVYGVGGVGSFVVEGLARSGVGYLILVDPDNYDVTNINRQLGALSSTIGKSKVEVLKERALDINPEIKVEAYRPSEIEGGETSLIDSSVSYVVDCIDTMANKFAIIEKCNNENVRIISATGAANKLDATAFEVSDIFKTSVCPVCKLLRNELRKRNIKHLKVVYSKEEPIKFEREEGKKVLGSMSYVPSTCGLIIAGEVIKDLIK